MIDAVITVQKARKASAPEGSPVAVVDEETRRR